MKRIFTLFVSLFFISSVGFAQTQASNIVFHPVAGAPTSISISWTNGTSTTGRIVVVKSAGSTYTPSTGNITSLNAGPAYANAASNDQDGTAEVAAVVFAGTTSGPALVTGLVSGIRYTVQVYEFTGATTAAAYILTSNLNNPALFNFYTSTGTFTVPNGINSVFVQAWGGGAGGGEGPSGNAGSGGGGGAFASGNASVSFGVNPTVTVGTGGAAGDDDDNGAVGLPSSLGTAVVAAGGSVDNAGGISAGGTIAGSTGLTRIAGGNGGAGDASGGDGGGGGGSSGSTGTVADGVSSLGTTTGGAGGNGTDGDGGKGGDASATNAVAGTYPGGGGGGRGDNGGTGAVGAPGLVIVSFSVPPTITSATLNYGTGVFVVTLSEAITSLNNVDATKFHINNSTGTDLVNLTEAEETSFTGNTITFTLTQAQRLAALAVSGTPGGAGGAVVLDVDAGGVTTSTANLIDDNNTVTETADTVAPTVLSVSSSTANGTYKTSDVIAITVTFSEVVNVTGTPRIQLETNTVDEFANYASGSGTAVLTFNYTVQAGDGDNGVTDLTEIANTLALNGGTITDVAGPSGVGNAANLAHPGGSLATLKDIKIDATAPTVTGVTSSAADATYLFGQSIDIIVTFSENAVVTGTPRVTLETGTTDRSVNYSSGSGTNAWTFTYTVQSGDISGNLDYTTAAVLDLNGGAIKDAIGNNAVLTLATPGAAGSISDNQAIVVNGVLPTVTDVTSTKIDGPYMAGELIDVTVTFSVPVTVTGTPQLTLETGSVDQVVNYSGGSTTNTLTFTYTVQAGDNSADLDYAGTSALTGTIKSAVGNNAVLTLATPGTAGSLGANKGLVIDTQAPAQPAAPDLTVGTDLGIPTDNITSDNTPDFSGAGSNGNTIKLFSSVDGQVGSMVVSGSAYSITASTLSGTTGTAHDMTVTETDPAGNVSIASPILTVTIDTSTPTGYSVVINQTPINNANKTAVSFTFAGAELGSTYNFSIDDAAAPGTTPVTGSGIVGAANATISGINVSTLNDGVLTLTVTLTDVAGNIGSNATDTESKDATPPSAITGITVATVTGNVFPNYLNSTNLSVDVGVPVANDATLVGGTIQLQVNAGSGFVNVGSAAPIGSAPQAAQVVNITKAQILAATSFVEGNTLSFTAIVTDNAGNSITASTSGTTLFVDQTAPVILDDVMSLTTGVDRIEFSVNEILSIPNGATSGFSVSLPTLSTQVYSLKGTTNLITLTSSASNNWSAIPTVSYSAGNIMDVAGNPLADISNHIVVVVQPPNLGPGDMAITSYKGSNDEFTVVFLKDVPLGTAIKFTDNGWRTTSFTTNETTLTITTLRYVYAGTEIKVAGTTVTPAGTASTSGSALDFGISGGGTTGDQLLVYQGLAGTANFAFVTALDMNGGWAAPGNDNDKEKSNLPTGLTDNTNANAFATEVDNAAYNFLVGGPANTATTPALLMAKIMVDASWTNNDVVGSVTFPTIGTGDNYVLPPDLSSVSPTLNAKTTLTPNLSITLNENIFPGNSLASGANDVELRRVSDDALIQSWNIGSPGFTIPSGASPTATISNVNTLVDNVQYKVNVKARIFRNSFFNYSTAVDGAIVWKFTADGIAPTVTSIVKKNPVGALTNGGTVQFTVNFSESVTGLALDDFSVNASVGITSTPVVSLVSSPSGTSVDVTVNTIVGNGTIGLNVLTANGISDVPGNPMTSNLVAGANETYTIDQAPPTIAVADITTDGNPVTLADNTIRVTLKYGETMNTAVNPTITFLNGTFAAGVPVAGGTNGWITTDVANDTYRADFTISSTDEQFSGVTVTANSAQDLIGNTQTVPVTSSAASGFVIDTRRPTVTSINRVSSTPNNNASLTWQVTFSEPVSGIDVTDFSVNVVQNPTLTTSGVTSFSTVSSSVYNVTVSGIAGNGTLRLDAKTSGAGATISDLYTNGFTAGFTAGQTIDVDQTPPTYVSITRQSAVNGFGGPGATTATSTISRLTFSENVVSIEYSAGPNNNVTGVSTGVAGGVTFGSFTGATSTTSNFVDITMSGLAGEGGYSLRFLENDDVTDLAGNPVNGVGFSEFYWNTPGNEYYTKVIPEPTSDVAALTVTSITSSSVTLQWSGPSTSQTHFLVMAKPNATPTYALPSGSEDGNYITTGLLAKNVVSTGTGIHTTTFTGLSSGVSYDFVIYPYSLYSPGNPGSITDNNVNYRTNTPANTTGVYPTGVLLPTALASTMALSTSNVAVSSILNNNTPGVNVLKFRVADDGYNPFSSNVTLFLNGTFQEKIIFTLGEQLTIAEGASVTGFSTSTGSIASAIYSGKGTTNTVTLTSSGDGNWNASTTIAYSSTGNMQGTTTGTFANIAAQAVVPATVVTVPYTSNNTFTVPAGVSTITVEAWGAGGAGGAGALGTYFDGGGGGGGGAYSRSVLAVTPSSSYGVAVGLGGTGSTGNGSAGGGSNFGGGLVFAPGGSGGFADNGSPGPGGNGGGFGTGNVVFAGGPGGLGNWGGSILPAAFGGGAGSSAGTGANGNPGVGDPTGVGTGGVAPLGGGNGGSGVDSGTGAFGFVPGGGGGGSGNGLGGNGAGGQIIVSYEDPTIISSTSYSADNSPFRFQQLIIGQQAGAGNSDLIDDWTAIIDGAELTDGTTTISGEILSNQIRFGYPSNALITSDNSGDFGFIDDAGSTPSVKDYTLKIWLLNPVSDALAAKIDNLTLGFEVTAAGFTLNNSNNQASSQFLGTQGALNSSNDIEVEATELLFQGPGATSPVLTNVPTHIGVGVPFSASTAQVPGVYALDANKNLDLDYTNVSATITNPAQNYLQSFSSAKFVNGKLDLSTFYFTSGTSTSTSTQLEVTGAINPPSLAAPSMITSSNVIPVISALTTVAAGATAEPGTIPSLTTELTGAIAPQLNAVQNFDFTIKDDDGANSSTFNDNDNLPTRINSITIRRPLAENGTVTGGADFDAWTKSIAGAELRFGSTVVATGTIFDDRIEFVGIPNNPHTNAYVSSGTPNNALEIVNVSNPAAPVHFGNIIDGAGGAELSFPLLSYISGKYVYVPSQSGNALQIVDISNPAAPIHVGNLLDGPGTTLLNPYGVYVRGNYAYVTSLGENALEIVNITNPSAPVHAGSISNGGLTLLNQPTVVQVVGDYAYISSVSSNALEIVNVSNPASPTHAGSLSGLTGAIGVYVAGDYAYVVGGNALRIVNISNPAAPTLAGTLLNGGSVLLSGARSVTVVGNYAYIASTSSNALEIVDISNPSAPLHVGSLTGITGPRSISVLGNYAYLSGSGGALTIVNISNPAAPVLASSMPNGGGAYLSDSYSVVVSNSASGDVGFIPDGQSKTFSLSISLKKPVDVTLRDKLDGEDFVFDINDNNDFGITSVAGNLSSTIGTFTKVTSGDGNNAVAVAATQLDFITQPNANQFYDKDITPAGALKARDVNQNLDTGFGFGVTNMTLGGDLVIPDGRTYPIVNGTGMTFAAGQVTLNSTLQVSSTGGGHEGDQTNLTVISNGVSGTSTTITMHYDNVSDIIKDAAFTTYTSNILYKDYQAANFTANTDGVALESFLLRDGGGTNDADGSATVLQGITLNIDNWKFLKTIALYNGTNLIAERAVAANINTGTGDLSFPTLATAFVTANDFTNTPITVYATFNSANVVDTAPFDNQVVRVKVISAIPSPVGSRFPVAGTSTTFATLAANENKIEVVATKIDFTTQPVAASISVNVTPTIVVSATDIFNNLDVDYNGAISATGNVPVSPGPFTTTNDPAIGSLFGASTAGQITYPTNFQFTAGDGNVQLTINAGAGSGAGNINAGAITGTSATISITTAYDSWVYFDKTFPYTPRIDFANKQELATTSTSQTLARVILSDGGALAGTENAPTHVDVDGSFTSINDFTISLSNFQDIRAIGIYASDGVTQIGSDKAPAASVTFDGLGIASYQAPDGGTYEFYIKASFKQVVTDLDQIAMQITAVTHNAGSKFPEQNPVTPPATIAGVLEGNGFGDSSPLTIATVPVNVLDVIATSLDFTGQPSTYAGINEPVGPSFTTAPAPSTTAGIVSARDVFANVDTDFTPATITLKDALDNVLIQPSGLGFISGVMNLNGMQYPVAVGNNGAVKVSTTGSTYQNISSPAVSSGNAITSNVVNVLDVGVTIDTNNGVVPGSSGQAPLKGGLQNVNIFGLKFTANATAGVEPKLKRFTISFKAGTNSPTANNWYENTNSGVVVLSGFNVFMNGTSNNVTSIGGVVSKVSSGSNGQFDQILVDLSSSPQSVGTGLTFYLVVNVDASTNSSTQTLVPYFIDAGYGTLSDKNSIVSNGTATGAFDGNEYSFASTQPPTLKADLKQYPLTSTRPYAGQPNVDPALPQIVLEFDTNVGVLDDLNTNQYTGELWSRLSNTKVADLKLNTVVPVAPLVGPTIPAAQGAVLNQTVANIYPKLVFDVVNKTIPSLINDEVYFVKIRQGSYDPITNTGHGITDYGLNFFGGITDNSTLYFKVSSNNPIKLSSALSTFNTTALGTITTSFDQLGTAYYLVVKVGDPAPTISEITGVTSYSAAHPTATVAAPTNYGIGTPGNYPITSVNAEQTYTFPANFVSGTNYDVYVFAKNDAQPTPVAATGIYGAAPGFTPGAAGPTLTISGIPSGQPIKTPNNPANNLIFTICPDSRVTITDPMIIGEQTNNSFFSAGYVQDFNILLPTGYEFDVAVAPTIQLIGNDFLPHGAPTWTYSYTSNTLLNVKFSNSGSTSTDYIAVSGLSIIGAAGSSQGNIQWFYGNNVFTPTSTPFFTLAQITMHAAPVPDFTNTFWYNNQQVAPFSATNPSANLAFQKTVNAIPDNYVDPNNVGAVRLLPSAPPFIAPSTFASGDYLASFFSGTGVSGDLLTLNAVQAGAAFNVFMLHSDLNGCTTSKKQQYVVYDHNSPISKKLGVTLNITTPVSPAGTKQDLVNTNFPTGAANPITPQQTVLYNELAGYYLMELKADLPASEIALNNLIPSSKSQIISGTAWRTLVQTQLLNPPITVPGSGNTNYHDFTWDYRKVLNETTPLAASGLTNVYDYFKSNGNNIPLSPNGNNYWTGGTLGKIEYTGVYQSTADNTVYVPFRQSVELFLPAVPLIEVTSPTATYDKLDPATTPNFNAVQYPATNKTNGYPGTAIFCEFGGTITLTGYPLATGGISNGTFAIYDYLSFSNKGTLRSGTITTVTSSSAVLGVGTQFTVDTKIGSIFYDGAGNLIGKVISIADNQHLTLQSFAAVALTSGNYKSVTPLLVPQPSSAFIDNGNGTMTIDPTNAAVQNTYKDAIVTYTYQDNNSPAIGTGYLILRITPNPVAKFVKASDLTAGSMALGKASAANAYCAAIPIIFDPTGSTIAADNIASYDWNFGDNSSANNVASSTVGSPTITNGYPTIGTYHATLTVKSDKGCSSINTDNFADITVGSMPTFSSVAFDISGIAKAPEQITFTDRTTAASNETNSFSRISNVVWNYGDGVIDGTGVHPYSAPGHFNVKATVTTAIGPSITTMTQAGCVRSFDRHIVILDKKSGFYEDDFEASTSTWQTIRDSSSTVGVSNVLSSWKRGTPTASRGYINSTPVALAVTNNNVWATGLTTTYAPFERSFLYSPAIDMTSFKRPMISFDANWALGKDGAVLEYSTDNLNVADPNKKWTTVGNNTTGVKWFTDQNIGSKPGNQPLGNFGWSGSSTNVDVPTGWVESKHELSTALTAAAPDPITNVVFRFSFATLNDGSTNELGSGTDGFAIDNFRIGERTRTILLEKFTSTNGVNNGDIITENSDVSAFQTDALNATTVVKLNYHIGFTKTDPFNLDNPADPSARALYYNVNGVPRVFLDGTRPDGVLLTAKFRTWGLNAYNSQTLQLGRANIDVNTVSTNADGSIKFNVEVTALYDLPGTTVVHVAMIEKSILRDDLPAFQKNLIQGGTNEPAFDFVLKKMLPNALGTKLGAPLAKNQKRTFDNFEYYPDPVKLYNNKNDLAVIVFLQDEITKVVYQTFITTTTINDPATVTGIEDPALSLEDVALFPNPADNEFTVQLPSASKTETRLRLADQVGKVVYDSFIPAGSTEKKVNTTDMAAGLYILQIESGNGGLARKKVMVVHNR